MSMTSMTWEEKLQALSNLCPTTLRMRTPGDWYVSAHGRSIGGDGLLRGTYGHGESPQAAVEDDWEHMTTLEPGKYIETSNGHWRWAGYMWQPVDRDG